MQFTLVDFFFNLKILFETNCYRKSNCNILESYMELFGQYVSPSKMTFELSRTQNGHHINDAQLSLSFDDEERLLRGRAYMRPTLWNDIKAKVHPQNYASSRLSSELSRLQRSLAYDMRLKSYNLKQAIGEPLSTVVDYYRSEVTRKWRQGVYSLDRMYRANEFYMHDIHRALKRHYDDFRYILLHLHVSNLYVLCVSIYLYSVYKCIVSL